jgi:hypothetical protein
MQSGLPDHVRPEVPVRFEFNQVGQEQPLIPIRADQIPQSNPTFTRNNLDESADAERKQVQHTSYLFVITKRRSIRIQCTCRVSS